MAKDKNDDRPIPTYGVPVEKGVEFLPKTIPKIPNLDFAGAGHGWPPIPLEWENVQPVEVEEIPGALTEELEVRIRKSAGENPRVQAVLGERHVHLTTDMRYFGKGVRPNPALPLDTRLIYFSHTNNIAVEVLMKGLSLVSVAVIPGFQPPEVPEEIEVAVKLARADPRLKNEVRDLGSGGLLLVRREGEIGYGHRLIWVTFFEPEDTEGEKPALYTAVVDLTDLKVLFTRREEPIEQSKN